MPRPIQARTSAGKADLQQSLLPYPATKPPTLTSATKSKDDRARTREQTTSAVSVNPAGKARKAIDLSSGTKVDRAMPGSMVTVWLNGMGATADPSGSGASHRGSESQPAKAHEDGKSPRQDEMHASAASEGKREKVDMEESSRPEYDLSHETQTIKVKAPLPKKRTSTSQKAEAKGKKVGYNKVLLVGLVLKVCITC